MRVLTPCRRAATLEDRMHHLETLIQAIPSAVFAAGGAVPGGSPAHLPDSSTSPLASFASSTHTYPSGVPPPSLHVFPLLEPILRISRQRIRDPDREGKAQTLFFSLCLVSTLVNSRHLLPMSSLSTLPECLCQPRTSISTTKGIHAGKARPPASLSLDILVENHASTTKHDSSDTKR